MPPEKAPQFNSDNPLIVRESNIALSWPVAVAICSLLIFGSWQLWDIRASIKEAAGDRWKKSYQREYNNRLYYSNPSLKVPDIDEITERMS